MTKVADVADRYIEEMAAANPVAATGWGVPGHEHRLPDLSPGGLEQRADVQRRALAALAEADAETPADRIASEVMAERLTTALALDETGESFRSLSVLHSPPAEVRRSFDLMASATGADWEAIAARMDAVPAALDQYRATLAEGISRGLVSARRQAIGVAAQCESWAGLTGGSAPYFAALAGRYPGGPLEDRIAETATAASGAFGELAAWLRSEYLPAATPIDPVGRDRYALAAAHYTGAELDLDDTYRFGWSELARIEARIAEVCDEIAPGSSFRETVDRLEADPDRVIEGADAFRSWNQALIDSTIAELNGRHFDIPGPVQRCEAMIAPPGGAAAMYYTGPSEDFSRPGRTWYPTLGKTRFPTWREVSICYHEGVPGHHLQIAQTRYRSDVLNRFQRLAGLTSGHAEGWALYAERLMGELGYLADPGYELGMLAAHAMRAVRVIVDIGMHLGLPIPDDERYHPGERWTAELALPFVIERSCFPADFMASEVDRYLGLPGQAISYKVGERVWLEAREAARARHGADFDLKAFHAFALDLGGMGLDQLERELARF